jgi:CO/xanthine dehydrogenase FAD-binding subunit
VTTAEVTVPTSPGEAAELFGDGVAVTVVGGGTIVVPLVTHGQLHPAHALMLHASGLDELVDGNTLTVGATVTLARLAEIAPEPLASAARIPDIEIRGQGTVGGNLHTGGDLQPALIALGARVRSVGAGGGRIEPVEDFLAGTEPRLVLAVELERPLAGVYLEQRRTHSRTYAVLSVAVARRDDGVHVAGELWDVRVARDVHRRERDRRRRLSHASASARGRVADDGGRSRRSGDRRRRRRGARCAGAEGERGGGRRDRVLDVRRDDRRLGRLDVPARRAGQETGECEPHAAISYASCVADVEVDDETGEVRVTKLVQVYDVGRAINPTLVEGQIQGGAVMGLGLALLEESYPYYPELSHRGPEFGAYAAPGMADLPELKNVVLEDPDPVGPFGAKAIGEMANNAQSPAIVAAIHDTVGVWVTELPARPERVLRALDESRQPRRDGRRVIYDEHLSVAAVSTAANRPEGAWRFPLVSE